MNPPDMTVPVHVRVATPGSDLPWYPLLDESWKAQAACRDADTRLFFPGQGETTYTKAVAICEQCPVTDECLAYANESGIHYGIWGGKSERQRRIAGGRRKQRRPNLVRAACGTNSGYIRHLQAGSTPCFECRQAHAIYQREYMAGRTAGGDAA